MIARPARDLILLLTLLLSTTSADAGVPPIPEIPGACDGRVLMDDPDRVLIGTPLGNITLQLFPSVAPDTVANFLGYRDRGDYDDGIAHRVVSDFVVQMGGFRFRNNSYEAIETQDQILLNEPCLSNVEGTIAMAKIGQGVPDPVNSATSQWFISLSDNSATLDSQNGGFTVFGLVLDGLEIAQAIGEFETLEAPLDPMDPMSPLALPELPTFYATVKNESNLYTLYRQSPVQNLPIIDSAAYGCFDSSQAGVLLVDDPQDVNDWEPDAARDLPYSIVSMACAGVGGAGPPSVPCSGPGRRVVLMDPETGLFVPDPNAEFFFAEGLLSCDDLAASEASFDARLTDVGAQLDTEFVRISVPEPGAGVSGAVGLLALVALARRSRRRAR